MGPSRIVSIEPPARVGRHAGLAYALFLPAGPPRGSILVLHGAGSAKESHYDFARAARAAGFAALAFDLRGHGESEGALGAGVLSDLRAMASLLPAAPLALRGSSMGGYLALVAARQLGARAVVAICPAGADMLRRGLRSRRSVWLDFELDQTSLDAFLAEHDELLAVADLECALLLLHAQGDEIVPVAHSIALDRTAARADPRRLLAVPGGHHRSVQHDGEMQAETLRWLGRALA